MGIVAPARASVNRRFGHAIMAGMGLYSRWVFPKVLDFFVSYPFIEEKRRGVLADARGDVLEIGFGTGRNLPFDPKDVRSLTIVDPNPGMHDAAREREKDLAFPLRAVLGVAEALPAADASIDTVVSTWSLCTIPEPERALAEGRRVLRPGGKFLFLEHGLSESPAVQRVQRVLNPINRVVADGCNIDRDIAGLVKACGLRLEALDRFYMERTPRFFGSSYRGIAVKD